MKTNPKTVKNSLALVAALFGCGMTLATTAPVYALSKSNDLHAATLSPSPVERKNITVAQAATAPIQGVQENEVKRKGYMKTSFNLDSDGNLNAITKTWTNVRLSGFTGGVYIVFVDSSGSAIWSTDQQRYGVDGTAIGNSSRTENWQAKVPPQISSQIKGYAIVQEPTPRGRILEFLRSKEGQETIKGIVKIVRND
jgi:hypothetical protein